MHREEVIRAKVIGIHDVAVRFLLLALGGMCSSGCATAKHEWLPPAQCYRLPQDCDVSTVALVREGDHPRGAVVPIAIVSARGGNDASRDLLESTLVKEAAAICADGVLVTNAEKTDDGAAAVAVGNTVVAAPIVHSHLYGVAFKNAAIATFGMRWNAETAVVEYVAPGSIAEEIGLQEGSKILTVNGQWVPGQMFTWVREVQCRKPGDVVEVEFSRGGRKFRRAAKLRPANSP